MFLKSAGEYIHGKWFCNDDCAEKDPQTMDMIKMLAKGIDFDNKKRELEIIKENEEEINRVE